MNLIGQTKLEAKMDLRRSTLNEHRNDGLLTSPIRFGKRNLWPEHEIDQIIAAKLAGKTNEQIRELVTQLHEARKQQDVAA